MLASIESFFIFLLIAGASALFNWIKKRGENTDDWSTTELPPPKRRESTIERRSTPASQPAPKTTSWEEELRRMLEGTVPTTQNPAPPPIIVQERKPQPPPAIPRQPAPRKEPVAAPTMSLPKTFEQKYYKAHCNHCDEHIEFPASAMEEVILCPHCQRPTILRPFENTAVEVAAHQNVLAELKASERAFEQASQLHQRVAAHMQEVGQKPVAMTSIQRAKKVSPDVTETVALFRNAKTVRQAIIASLILSPPKALEN